MRKTISVLGLAIALAACSPEESSKELTYKITEANAPQTLASSLTLAGEAEDMGSFDTIGLRSAEGRSLSRASEAQTFDCNSGTMTLSLTADDNLLASESMPANGQLSFSMSFNQCDNGYDKTDGDISTTMNWTGWDEYYDTFDSLTVSLEYDELNTTGSDGTYMVDGDFDMSMGSSDMSLSWDMYVASPELNNQMIRTRTTTAIDIGVNYNSVPTAGVIRIEGADDTYAEARVVPNGYEISVNGGQATLYGWDEL